MQIIGLIPARYNSTRFPGKMLTTIMGKSLIQLTYENCKKYKNFDQIFVLTDDERIKKEVEGFGSIALMTSKECQNGTERIIEALSLYPNLSSSDIIVNLQGDHPCIQPDTIDKVIEQLNDSNASIATAAALNTNEEHFFSPSCVKCVMNKNNEALYFSRSPIPYHQKGNDMSYYHHIGIYAYKTSFLVSFANRENIDLHLKEDLEQLKMLELGYSIKVAVVKEKAIGVDLLEDVEKIERYLCQ